MSSNYFYDASGLFHGSFDPLFPFSFIPPCLKSSPKQDRDNTYTTKIIDNQNDLNIVVSFKDDNS